MKKYVISILALLALISCQNIQKQDWVQLNAPEDLEFIWDMTTDESGNLWVAAAPQLVFISTDGKILEFPFDNDGPRSVCAGKSIGIITFEGKVVSLNSTNPFNTQFVVLRKDDKYQAAQCIVLSDQSLLIWKDYWIETIHSDGVTSMYNLELNKAIKDIAIDESGQFHLITNEGDVLYQNDMYGWKVENHPDLELASNEIAYFIRYVDNKIWIATSDKLFVFNRDFTNRKIVISTDILMGAKYRVLDVIQVGQDIIVASTDGLWRVASDEKSDNLSLEPLVGETPHLLSAIYDSTLERIYVALDRDKAGYGIYYLHSPIR